MEKPTIGILPVLLFTTNFNSYLALINTSDYIVRLYHIWLIISSGKIERITLSILSTYAIIPTLLICVRLLYVKKQITKTHLIFLKHPAYQLDQERHRCVYLGALASQKFAPIGITNN